MFFRGIILEIHSRFCLLMCFVSGKIDKCDCVCVYSRVRRLLTQPVIRTGKVWPPYRRVAVLQCYS